MNFRSLSSPRPHGFTLLELLVVMTMVAVLIALLLPALSKATALARRTDCQNRQRQWVMAFKNYADDNSGLIPREGWDPSGEVLIHNWGHVTGIGSQTSDVWFNALPVDLRQRPASDYVAPGLRSQFYERRNPLQCPSARFPGAVEKYSYQLALFSLAMNSHLIRSGEGPTIPISLIENLGPYRMVLFLDNLLEKERRVDLAQSQNNLGQPAAVADRFSARHGKRGNLSFVDGSVEAFLGNRIVDTRESSPRRGTALLPPDTSIIWEIPYRPYQ
jgi:prepilin-type N-terminal cleavage/methylation domain-containing protein/prepilin-type processing-associated H-X9-DG protein